MFCSCSLLLLSFFSSASFLVISFKFSFSALDFLDALKEVAFSYYMRGKYIQYNSIKKAFYSPEEATSQKINNLVCSQIVGSVYKELLNITTPDVTLHYVDYVNHKKTNTEIVFYTSISDKNNVTIKFNFPGLKYFKKNPTYKDIVQHLQPGDILIYCYNRNGTGIKAHGHTMMVLDVNKNKKDAFILESTDIDVNTKLSTFPLFFSKNKNTFGKFPEERGTSKIRKISEIKEWKVMNQEYS